MNQKRMNTKDTKVNPNVFSPSLKYEKFSVRAWSTKCFQSEFEIVNEIQHPPASIEEGMGPKPYWRKAQQVVEDSTCWYECKIKQIHRTNNFTLFKLVLIFKATIVILELFQEVKSIAVASGKFSRMKSLKQLWLDHLVQ